MIRLEFPKQRESGFDVVIEVSDALAAIETDHGWHLHQDRPSEHDGAQLFGLVRDMLSTSVRLTERRAGGRAYRWDLEAFVGDRWRPDGTTGLFLWNYFGRRSQSVYQNDTLPARPLEEP